MSDFSWFKVTIHCHTTMSDGDADPKTAVDWYQSHGYDFLVLSDHNHLTLFDYQAKDDSDLILIPGEEVTSSIGVDSIPLHINGIGINRLVEPADCKTVLESLQTNIDRILDAGGLVSINHPNYKWALTPEIISSSTGANMLEVFNGHPMTNTFGTGNKPSAEQIWDAVLTSGQKIFAAATDDAHNYHEFTPNHSNPGRGWLNVRASHLTSDGIIDSLRSGDFYSSTGVVLNEINADKNGISIEIERIPFVEYETTFVGEGGKVLDRCFGSNPEYVLQGEKGYVRATISDSNGFKAWIQPVHI